MARSGSTYRRHSVRVSASSGGVLSCPSDTTTTRAGPVSSASRIRSARWVGPAGRTVRGSVCPDTQWEVLSGARARIRWWQARAAASG
ncbi:hypothetical protein HFP72_01015 [Nocardiopsis sp. ARC36]